MKLYIPEHHKKNITEMQLSIMEKEINDLNETYPLEDEQIDFKKVYNIKTDEGAEAYFYIRNNTSKNVSLEHIPVRLKHGKREVAISNPDFKEIGAIPSKCAVAFKAKFKMEDILFPKYIAKAELYVEEKVLALKTIETEIENLPEDMDYHQKEFIEKYVSSLKNLRQDTLDVNVVTVSEGENKSLNISILVRNGYTAHGIEVATLPIKVFTESGVLIYKGAFESNDLKVNKASSKLFNIVLPQEQLLVKDGQDYSTFKIELD